MTDFSLPSSLPPLERERSFPKEGSGGVLTLPKVVPKLNQAPPLVPASAAPAQHQGFLPLQPTQATPRFPQASVPESAVIPPLTREPNSFPAGEPPFPRSGRMLVVGDVVKPKLGAFIQYEVYQYPQAVVVGTRPFVLVSTDARARWGEDAVSHDGFISCGKASEAMMRALLVRLRS